MATNRPVHLLQPIPHGHPNGAKLHRSRGELPCRPCLAAASHAVSVTHIRAGTRSSVRVPVELLGRLLRECDGDTSAAVEEAIGLPVAQACVDKAGGDHRG